MRPLLPAPGTKRKRSSSSSSDSEDDHVGLGGSDLPKPSATKRAKLVTASDGGPEPLDIPMPDLGGPIIGLPPVHTPAHVAVHVPVATVTPPPVAIHAVPHIPHLIPSTGRGPDAVSDREFNTTYVVDYEPLNAAAEVVFNTVGTKSKTDSENLGEKGAVAYIQAYTGYPDIELHNATVADPHVLSATDGQRWSHVVAFGGPNVSDTNYWDGKQFHVIEAKGGSSTHGTRAQFYVHEDMTGEEFLDANPDARKDRGVMANLAKDLGDDPGDWNFHAGDVVPFPVRNGYPTKLRQGTMDYLTDIGHAMKNSAVADGRNLVGQDILDHGNDVHYQSVNTTVGPDGGVDVRTMK